MIPRAALALAVGALQAAAALVVLGLPGRAGWADAWDFFVSRQPTMESALAASRLTVLLLALAMLAWALVGAARMASRGVAPRGRQMLAGAAALLVGLLILAAGLGHHAAGPSVVLGAGSVKEASQELAR